MKFEATVNDRTYNIEVDEAYSHAEVDDTAYPIKFHNLSDTRYLLRLGRKTYLLDNISQSGHSLEFTVNNRWYNVDVKDEQAILLAQMGFKDALSSGVGVLMAPMPGKVLDILVSEGEQVNQGDSLLILEAMKMENELKAPISGSIGAIHVEPGKSVEKKEILIEIKAIG